MKLAHPWWLAGAGLAVVVAAFLVIGGFLLLRSIRRFGEEERVAELVTTAAGARRATKGVLLVLAVALAFVALAGPKYGRGTRLIPATNLDVVVVLDYSKSMYARDVKPSRAARAKNEVAQLIEDLPGARFGAVAFAGEPLSFPLTSDGGAIAQFFRQLSPNDMPVGGTAIARALEAARELFARDPLSNKHEKVVVLVTDGEDLEGNPVEVARAVATANVTIHVVQIGGRTPEPLPDVDENGEVVGWRTTDNGVPITTSLSAEGEEQLGLIAKATGGSVVRSERGSTGIREISRRLRTMMTEELSEQVETVYADVYAYPLGLAILLLLLEAFIGEARRRPKPAAVAPPPKKRRRASRRRRTATTTATLVVAFVIVACQQTDDLFMRNAPAVDEAIAAYDGGDATTATSILQAYLSTGACEGGSIGAPEQITDLPNAGYDLGLALFEIGESFGRRFGEEERFGDAGMTPEEEAQLASRSEQVDCALFVVERIATDRTLPIDLRARASYLAGNLEFLRRGYRKAVEHYDRALALIPGLPEDAGADGTGRDAAWNRAIALRRIEEQEPPDASPDAPDDAPNDGSDDGGDAGDGGDGGGDDQQDGGDGGGDDTSPDAGGPDADSEEDDEDQQDGGGEQKEPPPDEQEEPEAEPPPESANQDQRMLDMLERAPTLQDLEAQRRGRPVQGMEDK